MTLDDIVRRTDRIFSPSARGWAWARFLADARTASNDDRRAAQSDRGRFNQQVDLLGALGELFLLRTAAAAERSAEAVAYMRGHLYDERGGANVVGPDISFADHEDGEVRGIDVKTFDCAPNKRKFAINDRKHCRLGGQCSHYLCVIAPPFGPRMAVSRLVPYSDVDDWRVSHLRHGGSASRNLPIGEFLRTYFSQPPSLDALRLTAIPVGEIDAACDDPAVRREFTEFVPGVPFRS